MIFELTVLGSSSAIPTSTKFLTAHVLNAHERFFLIDCGEGTQIQLRKAKINFAKINHIFISHLHGDHVFGLFGLISTLNLLGRETPLHIYGHSDLEKIIEFFRKQFAKENMFPIEIHPIVKRSIQKVYEDKVVEVFAFPLKHGVPTFGYFFIEKERPLNIRKDAIEKYNLTIEQINEIKNRADLILESGEKIPNDKLTEVPYKRRSYAYCSDTMPYMKIVPYIKNTDLLYHEATFRDKDKSIAKETGHSTTMQAAKIASKAEAGQLIIGHFSNRYKNEDSLLTEAKSVFPNTVLARELESYSVPMVRE